MSCPPALTRALLRWAGKAPANKTTLETALETALSATIAGEENVISASSDGSSFSRLTGGMTNAQIVACLDGVLDILDNHGGRMPNTTTYAQIR